MTKQPQKAAKETKESNEAQRGEETGAEADKNEYASLVEMLQAQHKTLEAALEKRSEEGGDINVAIREFARAWIPHDGTEMGVLSPAFRKAGADAEALEQSAIRHDFINLLLADLIQQEDQPTAKAKFEVLASEFEISKTQEEELGDLTERLEAAGKQTPDLAGVAKERFEDLKRRCERIGDNLREALVALAPRSLSVVTSQRYAKERNMQRNSNMRERDDQGRFMSEDDRDHDRRGRSGYESGRGGYESESRGPSRGGYDDDRNERRSRSRYDEDDRRSSGGGSGRSEGGRSQGGWFGDSEGHSQAARRGWQNSDHGDSGWFGDSQGHSQASRRGWEEGHDGQRRGDNDGRSSGGNRGEYRSRGRDDDDRGGRSQSGHGGWFGDSEGHSQAARRGRDDREGGERSRYDDDDRGRRSSRYDR